MVMIIVGVMAAYVLPKMLDLSLWRVRAFADELQAQSMAMQRLASAQRRPVVATLDTTGVSFAYVAGGVIATVACPSGASPCITEAGPRTVTFNSGNSGRAVTSTGNALPVTIAHDGSTFSYQIEAETGLFRPLP